LWLLGVLGTETPDDICIDKVWRTILLFLFLLFYLKFIYSILHE
jgi:hypothetical protein